MNKIGIKHNKRVGQAGEEKAKHWAMMTGNKATRTGIGSDFLFEQQYGDKSKDGLYEIKTGNAKLSPLQEKTKKKNKKKYHVQREHVMEEDFLGGIILYKKIMV